MGRESKKKNERRDKRASEHCAKESEQDDSGLELENQGEDLEGVFWLSLYMPG